MLHQIKMTTAMILPSHLTLIHFRFTNECFCAEFSKIYFQQNGHKSSFLKRLSFDRHASLATHKFHTFSGSQSLLIYIPFPPSPTQARTRPPVCPRPPPSKRSAASLSLARSPLRYLCPREMEPPAAKPPPPPPPPAAAVTPAIPQTPRPTLPSPAKRSPARGGSR